MYLFKQLAKTYRHIKEETGRKENLRIINDLTKRSYNKDHLLKSMP